MSGVGDVADSTVIASSAIAMEAMVSPAVAIAPTGPWAHAHEDAVVEITRPVISHWSARVWLIAVVTVRTDGLNTDVHRNLRTSRWRKSQTAKQRCD
jgi:hypothetical protein